MMRGKCIGHGYVENRRGVVDIFADLDNTNYLHCKTNRGEWLYLHRSRVTFSRNVP